MKNIKEKCLDILYPPRCPVCNRILDDRMRSTCEECGEAFHAITDHYCMRCGRPVRETEEYCSECICRNRSFRQGRGVFLYNTQMKQSLLRYKFYGSREYGKYYAECICRYAGDDIRRWNPDVIVPVPMHRRKQRMRGYNQAADLAERIGGMLGIPVADDIVYKAKETKAQKKLDASERKRNLKDAFRTSYPVDGLKILIVDDVYTTGSTVEAMAECLLEAGAREVYFATLCMVNI